MNYLSKISVILLVSLLSQTLGAFTLNYQSKTQQNNDVYHVIVASYQNEVYALNKVNSLKNLGFVDAKIIKNKKSKFLRVSLKSFKDKSDANIFLKENNTILMCLKY